MQVIGACSIRADTDVFDWFLMDSLQERLGCIVLLDVTCDINFENMF